MIDALILCYGLWKQVVHAYARAHIHARTQDWWPQRSLLCIFPPAVTSSALTSVHAHPRRAPTRTQEAVEMRGRASHRKPRGFFVSEEERSNAGRRAAEAKDNEENMKVPSTKKPRSQQNDSIVVTTRTPESMSELASICRACQYACGRCTASLYCCSLSVRTGGRKCVCFCVGVRVVTNEWHVLWSNHFDLRAADDVTVFHREGAGRRCWQGRCDV